MVDTQYNNPLGITPRRRDPFAVPLPAAGPQREAVPQPLLQPPDETPAPPVAPVESPAPTAEPPLLNPAPPVTPPPVQPPVTVAPPQPTVPPSAPQPQASPGMTPTPLPFVPAPETDKDRLQRMLENAVLGNNNPAGYQRAAESENNPFRQRFALSLRNYIRANGGTVPSNNTQEINWGNSDNAELRRRYFAEEYEGEARRYINASVAALDGYQDRAVPRALYNQLGNVAAANDISANLGNQAVGSVLGGVASMFGPLGGLFSGIFGGLGAIIGDLLINIPGIGPLMNQFGMCISNMSTRGWDWEAAGQDSDRTRHAAQFIGGIRGVQLQGEDAVCMAHIFDMSRRQPPNMAGITTPMVGPTTFQGIVNELDRIKTSNPNDANARDLLIAMQRDPAHTAINGNQLRLVHLQDGNYAVVNGNMVTQRLPNGRLQTSMMPLDLAAGQQALDTFREIAEGIGEARVRPNGLLAAIPGISGGMTVTEIMGQALPFLPGAPPTR